MQETVPVEVIHRCNNLYINILHYKYFANLFVFRFFFLSLTHAKGPAHRTSGGSNQIFKEQLEAAARREEHGQLLICELTMQVRQLTESVHSLEEALTLKNGKLKKQENISRGLGKLISNESEKQVPGKSGGGPSDGSLPSMPFSQRAGKQ